MNLFVLQDNLRITYFLKSFGHCSWYCDKPEDSWLELLLPGEGRMVCHPLSMYPNLTQLLLRLHIRYLKNNSTLYIITNDYLKQLIAIILIAIIILWKELVKYCFYHLKKIILFKFKYTYLISQCININLMKRISVIINFLLKKV